MRPIPLPAYIAVLALPLLVGCYSRISEQHTFVAANDSKRDLSLVRVEVDGYAQMADMKFRAGFRSTSAVDEVLKGDTTPITVQGTEPSYQKLNEKSEEITAQLLDKLKAAYAGNALPEERRTIEEEIIRARSLPRIVRAGETSLVSEAPAEKFIVAFSADPSKVFKAIADTTARNESEGAIFKSLKDFAAEEQARHQAERSTVRTTWQALMKRVPADLPDPNAANAKQDEVYAQLQERLRAYELLLQNFLNARP